MRKLKAVLTLLAVFGSLAVVMKPARQADMGGLFGSTWGAAGAYVGTIVGGIAGGLAGSAIAPGPGTVIGEMTGSDLGMLVGAA